MSEIPQYLCRGFLPSTYAVSSHTRQHLKVTAPLTCSELSWPWAPSDITSAPHIWLRLLETTDVHANILPFDYYANRGDRPYGLARVATLIHQARAEAPNCLLFDNGDFLQGTPLSDMTARPGSGWPGAHPIITAMNSLRYDAATLGNHEFNFGLDGASELRAALGAARLPAVTCANLAPRVDGGGLWWFVAVKRDAGPCTVTDGAGRPAHPEGRRFRPVLPPQVAHLGQVPEDRRAAGPPGISWRTAARARGGASGRRAPTWWWLLAHTGIRSRRRMSQRHGKRGARTWRRCPDVDAVVAGHIHKVFPGPGAPSGTRCRLTPAARVLGHGRPVVMPGASAVRIWGGSISGSDARTRTGWACGGSPGGAGDCPPSDWPDPIPSVTTLAWRRRMRRTLDPGAQAPIGHTDRRRSTAISRCVSGRRVRSRLVTQAERDAGLGPRRCWHGPGPPAGAGLGFRADDNDRRPGRGRRHYTDIRRRADDAGATVADLQFVSQHTLSVLRLSGAEIRGVAGDVRPACYNRHERRTRRAHSRCSTGMMPGL